MNVPETGNIADARFYICDYRSQTIITHKPTIPSCPASKSSERPAWGPITDLERLNRYFWNVYCDRSRTRLYSETFWPFRDTCHSGKTPGKTGHSRPL